MCDRFVLPGAETLEPRGDTNAAGRDRDVVAALTALSSFIWCDRSTWVL
jgi:hypothetical protein